MSGTLAIAAVSAVLKYLLLTSQADFNVSGTLNKMQITARPPDLVGDDEASINIFFHRATPNPGWSLLDHPSRDARGERVTNPYLALDLHYLITAHATQDFEGEIMLGYALHVMHENPVLGRQTIRDALRPSTTTLPNPLVTTETTEALLATFAAADLAEQFEQIKIAPYIMSSEDASSFWDSLQTHYRPAAAYTVSVVLIRNRRPARASLPVRDYNVYALPFNQPLVTEVLAENGPGTPIVSSKKLVLRGLHLRGDDTRVLLAGVEVRPSHAGSGMTVGEREISLNFPASARPGIQAVQVKHYLRMGTPPAPHRGFESNVAAFVLQPQIRKQGNDYMLLVIPPTGTEVRLLRVTLDPAVGPSQRAELLLNEMNAPDTRPARAYGIEAPSRAPDSASTNQLDFPVDTVAAGQYLVRVRIDGADSPWILWPAKAMSRRR